MKIKVIKRDKTKEDYDTNKLTSVTKAAGLTNEQSKKLTKLVTDWLNKSKLKEVTSLQIRDRVVIEIQKLNKNAAKKFIWYEKYKDKNYGVKY